MTVFVSAKKIGVNATNISKWMHTLVHKIKYQHMEN